MLGKWFDLRRFVGFSPDNVDSFLKNEAVRSNLRKHGDNSKTPRAIEHYAYFPTDELRASYRDFIISLGYQVEREDFGAGDDGKIVIVFSKVQAPIAIDKETALLDDHARQLGGDYDGWETKVIRRP
jgi:hypothetical protein